MNEPLSPINPAGSSKVNISKENTESVGYEGILEYIDAAWAAKKFVIICTAIGFMLATLLIILNRYSRYVERYDYKIQFVFPSVTDGTYPNGSPFLIADITAPAILSQVYTKNDISKLGIGTDEFATLIKITSFSVSERAIVEKYNAIFDERKSSLADIEKYQRDLVSELNQETRSAGLIRLEDPEGKIPLATAQSILIDIVSTWSKFAIEKRGVLKDGVQVINPALFTENSLGPLENLNKLRILSSRIGQLDKALDMVASSASGLRITDPESGLTTLDIKSQLGAVRLNLREVAASWPEKAATDTRGQRLNIQLYSDRSFEEILAGDEEYLVQIDIFEEVVSSAKQNVEAILAQPYGAVVTDPETGLTAVDIQQLLAEMIQFDLGTIRAPIVQNGIARDHDALLRYYKTKQSDMLRQIASLKRKAQTVLSALNPQDDFSNIRQPDDSAGTAGNSTPTTVIPQFGEGFIDKIIELSSRGNDGEFRRALTQKAIEFRNEISDLERGLERIAEYVGTVRANKQGVAPKERLELIEKIRERVSVQLDTIFAKATSYAKATVRISRRLRHASEIHQILDGSANGQVVNVDFYLRDGIDRENEITEVLGRLGKISELITLLNKEADNSTYGSTQRLFVPLSTPDQTTVKLFGVRSLLLIGLATLLFFFISGFVGVSLTIAKRRRQKSA